MSAHVVGLDVGSTYLKALLMTAQGEELCEARRRTPWRNLPGGRTEMDASVLLAAVEELLAELAAATGVVGVGDVRGIGISGMAEAGALLPDTDDHGDNRGGDAVELPMIAWFDPRGAEEIAGLDPQFLARFPRRTGLPAGPLATFAKLLHARGNGVSMAGRHWLNLPEYVAYALGGGRFGEPSMRSRTGLIDQDTGAAWAEPLELLGATADLLPPARDAGRSWGIATRLVPPAFRGAVLTVAGHDHLVASVGAGCVAPTDLYSSLGTAEALVRVLDGTLDGETRARLAVHGINVGRHLLPGRGVMIAGIKTGLLLRRLLQLVGVTDAAGRARLDEQVMALPAAATAAHALHVTGADNSDGVLSVRADGDGLSPELFFAVTLDHCTHTLVDVLRRMDAEVGAAERTVLSGGWSSMRSVRRARAQVLPGLQISDRAEDTAYGAGLIGAFAGLDTELDLATFTREFSSPQLSGPQLSGPRLSKGCSV
jgi:sugar (pentulose or hexulose) kinase